jgi:hypothetical protein
MKDSEMVSVVSAVKAEESLVDVHTETTEDYEKPENVLYPPLLICPNG